MRSSDAGVNPALPSYPCHETISTTRGNAKTTRRERMTGWRGRSEHPADRLVRILRSQGIADERVLQAIRDVPRDQFVPEDMRRQAWDNHALPIGEGQTISQPYVVAAMTAALALQGHETILEIGTGSGYQAAILSVLAKEVVSIERIESLAERARETLTRLGYTNIEVIEGDGSEGWPPGAPYDGIIVTAGAPVTPPALTAQLRQDGGRLVLPVGPERNQMLLLITRHGDTFTETSLGPVAFVPLIGRGGWTESALSPAPFDEDDWIP
jgi:protein-L-isoaspartate(D-aspartate) O-methyltransferase